MGWPSCSPAVGRLLQGLLSGCRRCGRLLQQLLQLLLHMKATRLIRHSASSWNWLWGSDRAHQRQLRVLLVGKRFTGKTTFLYRLKIGAFIPTKPSVGSNTELVVLHLGHHTQGEEQREEPLDVESAPALPSTNTVRVAFCDVAGGDGESLEWQGLQQGCDCVCFALDSSAPLPSVEDARREFLELFYDEHFVLRRSTPFLILATKQDLHNARSTAEIGGLLELPEEVKETCQVLGCSALSGAGLAQVQQWLVNVAFSVSRANSFWRSACPRNFQRGGSRAAMTSAGSGLSDRQQELLGTCATEASSFIQPLQPEHQLKADVGDEALRQVLQTTVLL